MDDVISGVCDEEAVNYPPRVPEPPRPITDDKSIEDAMAAIRSASNPLVIIGKGAAYSRAEDEIRPVLRDDADPLPRFSDGPRPSCRTNHPLSAGAARSYRTAERRPRLPHGRAVELDHALGMPPPLQARVRVVQMTSPRRRRPQLPTEAAAPVGKTNGKTGQLNVLEAAPVADTRQT